MGRRSRPDEFLHIRGLKKWASVQFPLTPPLRGWMPANPLSGLFGQAGQGETKKEEKDVIRIDNEKCSGCGGCVDACVDEVLAMKGAEVVVKNPDDCDECGDCEMVCPFEAITGGEE